MVDPVYILGAGPAGSIGAILLARAGFHVIVIEQHRFPRDKVCGECLSALAIDVLERIGAIDLVGRAGAIELHRTIVHAPGGSSIDLQLPRPMLGISRARLDIILLDLARHSGATVNHARCERVSPMLSLRDLHDNHLTDIRADCVLVATGKPAGQPRDFGIKAHFTKAACSRDAIELFGVRGSYGGIAPVENDRFNISFSVPVGRMTPDLDALFHELIAENRALQSAMRGAIRVSDWHSAPLHRSRLAGFDERLIPIGNAACSIEPIGGEGIGLAMRSAELAADAIVTNNVAKLQAKYAQLWRSRRLACRAAAIVLSRPRLANFLIDGIDARDAFFTSILRLIGKSPAIA